MKFPTDDSWGHDKLSEFLEQARKNQNAAYKGSKLGVPELVEADDCFAKVSENFIHPQNLIIALLFHRCHSAFRVACSLAMAGQSTEVNTMSRTVLETAGYAAIANRSDAATEVWLNRNESDETLNKTKKQFNAAEIKNATNELDKRLAHWFQDLYETSIDFGGHPNQRSVTGSLTIEKSDGQQLLNSVYLHGEDVAFYHGISHVLRCGMFGLTTFEKLLREKFLLLGVSKRLNELQRRYDDVLRDQFLKQVESIRNV